MTDSIALKAIYHLASGQHNTKQTHPLKSENRIDIVCYGIGSFSCSNNSVFQLALVNAVKWKIQEQLGVSSIGSVDIFDPVMNQVHLQL